MSESPVCPQVPTANSAVEDVRLRAGVGPAEYSFLSPALSSVRGAQIAPPALRGAVMLPLGPLPPSLYLVRLIPVPTHPSKPPQLPASVLPTPQFPCCLQVGPSSPLRWTPPALTWPTGEAHLLLKVPSHPQPFPSLFSLTDLLALHPLFPAPWALGHFSLQAPSPPPGGLP